MLFPLVDARIGRRFIPGGGPDDVRLPIAFDAWEIPLESAAIAVAPVGGGAFRGLETEGIGVADVLDPQAVAHIAAHRRRTGFAAHEDTEAPCLLRDLRLPQNVRAVGMHRLCRLGRLVDV